MRIQRIPLVSGMSATVMIRDEAVSAAGQFWFGRVVAAVETTLGCADGTACEAGMHSGDNHRTRNSGILPMDAATSGATAEQIIPGLAPSMNASPRNRN